MQKSSSARDEAGARQNYLILLRPATSVLLIAALLAGGVPAVTAEPSPRDLYKQGRKYEKKGDFANAYLLYAQAAAAAPGKTEYWHRAQALQRKAITAANVMPSIAAAPLPALAPEPQAAPDLPDATIEDIVEARQPQPPVEIEASAERNDFDLKADSKSLWEQVSKAYGLDVVFDGDFEAGPVQKFSLTDAGYREALHALTTATGSFFVPISPRLLLIVKDTEQKRREVENTVAVAIPIPAPVTIQEAQELARSVQQLMEIQRFAIDSAQRVAVMRDRISKVRPAQLLFQQLLGHRAQVAIEVYLMAASKSSTTELGLGVPASFPILPIEKTVTLAGGPLSLALGVTTFANLLARATRSEAKTMYQAELRSLDGMPSSMHVGQKYPITTVAYIGEVPEGEQAYTPPPSFNFEDLGLVLKITPKVHDSQEVSLQIEAEFKLLGAGSLNGIPVISNRQFATIARLRFDEAAVISGLVTRNDIKTLSGPAGLLSIPILGTFLGQANWTSDNIQVLLVMKPRLLSIPPTEMVTRDIWVGSESRPRIPL